MGSFEVRSPGINTCRLMFSAGEKNYLRQSLFTRRDGESRLFFRLVPVLPWYYNMAVG